MPGNELFDFVAEFNQAARDDEDSYYEMQRFEADDYRHECDDLYDNYQAMMRTPTCCICGTHTWLTLREYPVCNSFPCLQELLTRHEAKEKD